MKINRQRISPSIPPLLESTDKRCAMQAQKIGECAPSQSVLHGFLRFSVQYACPHRGLPTRFQLRRFVRAALQQSAEITLRIVNSEEAQQLNQQYRGKSYVPNVLSFPLTDTPYLLGDIVLCAPVVASEALEQGKSLLAHYAHLVIHGVLHLQGHDHQTDAEATTMENLETAILEKLGYPSPYLHS